MSPMQFVRLKVGDLIRHKSDHKAYVVSGNYGDRVTAVRTVDMTNPSEWALVREDGSEIADYEIYSGDSIEGDGYYWFKAERATGRSIAQRVNGQWFTVNEAGPITLEELMKRGWHIDERVR